MKFITSILVLLAIAFPVKAANTTITSVPNEQTVLQKPTDQELAYAEEIRIASLSRELTAKAESQVGTLQGQCVVAVRKFLGVGKDVLQGAAKNTRVDKGAGPEVGSIIVFWGTARNPYGHVGVVLFTTSDNYVYYYSPNSTGSKATSGGPVKIQKIKLNSPTIKGYRIIETIQFV